MAQTAPKQPNDKAEVSVHDHQTGNTSTMLFIAYKNLQHEQVTKGGKRIMRYTLGKSVVGAPVKKENTN